MNERSVVIFGGKGTAINVAEQIEDARRRHGHPMRVTGFAIDDPSLGREIAGFPVVSGVQEAWAKYHDTEVDFIFALYRPDKMQARYEMIATLGIPASRFACFVHPSAYMSSSASVGHGTVVLSNSSVQYRASIGAFCIVNSNVVVEHEVCINEGAFLAAGACVGARARIGTATFIGLNAVIREDVVVGNSAFIGMAATVVRDVDAGALVFGSPARSPR